MNATSSRADLFRNWTGKNYGLRVSMTVELSVGEIFASDWIYAASFASESDSV